MVMTMTKLAAKERENKRSPLQKYMRSDPLRYSPLYVCSWHPGHSLDVDASYRSLRHLLTSVNAIRKTITDQPPAPELFLRRSINDYCDNAACHPSKSTD